MVEGLEGRGRSSWRSERLPCAPAHRGVAIGRTRLRPGRRPTFGDTQEVILRTYSHLMPDDEDRVREIMDRFLEPQSGASSAPDVPRVAR